MTVTANVFIRGERVALRPGRHKSGAHTLTIPNNDGDHVTLFFDDRAAFDEFARSVKVAVEGVDMVDPI